MLTKCEKATLHLEYLVTPDFIVRGKFKGEMPLLSCSMSALRYENHLERNANK